MILTLYLLINNSLERVLWLSKEALRPGKQQVQQLTSIQKASAGQTAGTRLRWSCKFQWGNKTQGHVQTLEVKHSCLSLMSFCKARVKSGRGSVSGTNCQEARTRRAEQWWERGDGHAGRFTIRLRERVEPSLQKASGHLSAPKAPLQTPGRHRPPQPAAQTLSKANRGTKHWGKMRRKGP